jgi:hypothetical protein
MVRPDGEIKAARAAESSAFPSSRRPPHLLDRGHCRPRSARSVPAHMMRDREAMAAMIERTCKGRLYVLVLLDL